VVGHVEHWDWVLRKIRICSPLYLPLAGAGSFLASGKRRAMCTAPGNLENPAPSARALKSGEQRVLYECGQWNRGALISTQRLTIFC